MDSQKQDDRKRAYYLGMSYDKFVKRKAELMWQAAILKEDELLNERLKSIETATT